MKKTLLILISLFCLFAVNAQKHIASATPAKKISINVLHSGAQKPAAAACDTLKIDSANNIWSSTNWKVNGGTDGYVFGVNYSSGLSFEEDANYYDVSGSDYTYITGGLVDFGVANSTNPANLSKNLIFKIYADNGASRPGTLLGSTTLTLSHVKKDVANNAYTEFLFDIPIQIPVNKIFYVSVDHSNFKWGSSTKDSIEIIADGNNEAPAAAYQFISGGWYPVKDFWIDSLGSSLSANLFIFPYVNNSLSGCSTLPVSIINFKGSITNNEALLSWSTAIEFNNKGFSIERSKDGKIFTQIGFVNGAGTTTQRTDYTYTDATLNDFNSTTNYYRLKQVDLDGKTSYSNVLPLSLKNILEWKLYPNPIKNKLTVELNLTTDSKVSVQIISKDGKLLLNVDKGTLLQGQQQLSFNIQNLPGGSYYVRVKTDDKNYTQIIIKQ